MHGDGLSWRDLITLAGTTAIHSMGGQVTSCCTSCVDSGDGQESLLMCGLPRAHDADYVRYVLSACHVRGDPGRVLSVCLETHVEHRGGLWLRCRCANWCCRGTSPIFCGRPVEADKVVDVPVVMVRQLPTIWKVLKGGRGTPGATHRRGCRGASGVAETSLCDSAEDCRCCTGAVFW